MRLLTGLILVVIALNCNSIKGQPSLEDSMVTMAIKLSDKAFYDARFDDARQLVNLSYFRSFKDFKIEHKIQLSIQKMRIDGVANNVYNKKSDQKANLKILLSLLSHSNKIEDKKVLGQLYYALSQFYYANDKKDSSLIYYEKSKKIFQETKSYEDLAKMRAYDISAKHMMLLKKGDKDRILELIPEYEKEIEIGQKYSKYVLAYNTRHLAQIYRRQTLEFEKALHLFKWSLDLRREIGFKPYLAPSYASLGDVYAKMGEDELAIEMYTTSSNLAEEVGFVRFQLYPNLQIGDIYLKQQKVDKANEYYLKALKLSSKNNYETGIDQSAERIQKLNSSNSGK